MPQTITPIVPYRNDYLQLSLTLRLSCDVNLHIFFHRTDVLPSELLARDLQVLYTDFSASRQRELLAFPRCVQVATLIPNSDSATTLNRCFYCSPDPHTAFTCDTIGAVTQVQGFAPLHYIGRPLQHSSYPQVSLIRCSDLFTIHLSTLVQRIIH